MTPDLPELAAAYRAHEKAREACLQLRAYEMSNSRRLPEGHRARMMSAESALGTATSRLATVLREVVEAVEESQR